MKSCPNRQAEAARSQFKNIFVTRKKSLLSLKSCRAGSQVHSGSWANSRARVEDVEGFQLEILLLPHPGLQHTGWSI